MWEEDQQDLSELRAIVHENERHLADLQMRLLKLENLLLAAKFWPERIPIMIEAYSTTTDSWHGHSPGA